MSNFFWTTCIIASLSNLTSVEHKILISEDEEWQYYKVALDIEEFEQGQWLRNGSDLTDYQFGIFLQDKQQVENFSIFLQDKQQVENFSIFPLNTQVINLAPSSELWTGENWTLTNSFRAAYITWDEHNRVGASQQKKQFEREFNYDEFLLEEFYNLSLESSQNFQTATIQHETTIGIELNKNIFGRTSRQSSQGELVSLVLPNPYVAEDFVSKKNYLGLYIEHEALFGDRLALSFEGTLDVAIPDTIDFAETSLIESIENNNFFPEISLEY